MAISSIMNWSGKVIISSKSQWLMNLTQYIILWPVGYGGKPLRD
jgi:hypothetical protein